MLRRSDFFRLATFELKRSFYNGKLMRKFSKSIEMWKYEDESANSENKKIYRKKLSERVLYHLNALLRPYCLKMIVFFGFFA